MKKSIIGGAVMAALVIPLALAPTAYAADGQEFIVNGDFSNYDPATGANLDGVTVTDFSLTTSLNEASSPNNGDMYDPGIYAISTNAGSLHNQWVEQLDGNPKMVLNGFTEGTQTVWEQTATGVTCDVPGSQIQFEFTADVANVLPLDQYSDGGANISVFINGEPLGVPVDLTSNDGTPVSITGDPIDAAASFKIEVRNTGTDYIGNDFSLDNLSLVQKGECLLPATVSFDVPTTDPTCEAGEMFSLPIEPREGYTLTFEPGTNPGEWVITATAAEGYAFADDAPGTGDAFVRSVTVTLDGPLTGEVCIPDIGGKTIGFWTNKNGTAAEGGTLWALVKAEYPVQTAGLNTFGQAQTFIKNATSTGTGITMLRAQFFATALNVQYIAGYGAQEFVVPATSAILPGETVTVVEYLNAIEAGWASLDTKAEITSVQEVLNAINQDVASELFV